MRKRANGIKYIWLFLCWMTGMNIFAVCVNWEAEDDNGTIIYKESTIPTCFNVDAEGDYCIVSDVSYAIDKAGNICGPAGAGGCLINTGEPYEGDMFSYAAPITIEGCALNGTRYSKTFPVPLSDATPLLLLLLGIYGFFISRKNTLKWRSHDILQHRM